MPVERSLEFARIPEAVLTAARKVELLIVDVDGVMTDGGLYYDAAGGVIKRFHVHDGLGVALARRCGLKIAVITGQDSPAVAARMRDLKIEDYFPGFIDKRESYATVRERHGLLPEQVAYLGDDWVDLPVICQVGLPLAVADAQPEVKAAALHVTAAKGGHGAVREAICLILHSRRVLDSALAGWMETYTQ